MTLVRPRTTLYWKNLVLVVVVVLESKALQYQTAKKQYPKNRKPINIKF